MERDDREKWKGMTGRTTITKKSHKNINKMLSAKIKFY